MRITDTQMIAVNFNLIQKSQRFNNWEVSGKQFQDHSISGLAGS